MKAITREAEQKDFTVFLFWVFSLLTNAVRRFVPPNLRGKEGACAADDSLFRNSQFQLHKYCAKAKSSQKHLLLCTVELFFLHSDHQSRPIFKMDYLSPYGLLLFTAVCWECTVIG